MTAADEYERECDRVLAAHPIECTGPGEVTCRGCRERGWMTWREYRAHLAQALAADPGVRASNEVGRTCADADILVLLDALDEAQTSARLRGSTEQAIRDKMSDPSAREDRDR